MANPLGIDFADAANPLTSPERLQQLAAHPQLRPIVAQNPSAYPALREWIAAQPPVEPPRAANKTLIVVAIIAVIALVGGGVTAALLVNQATVAAEQLEDFCTTGLDSELIGNGGNDNPFSGVEEDDQAAFIAANADRYESWMEELDDLSDLVPSGDDELLSDNLYSAQLHLGTLFSNEAGGDDEWGDLDNSLSEATGWISRNCEDYY